MRRMSPESARRWSALSVADLEAKSRKSFGVQTRIDLSRFMRSRMPRLRSRFGPRRGELVCPIFVDIFRTDPHRTSCPINVYIFRTNPMVPHKERGRKLGEHRERRAPPDGRLEYHQGLEVYLI